MRHTAEIARASADGGQQFGAGPELREPDTPEAGANRITPQARRHNEMRRDLLSRHPEARALAGPEWRGALALPVLLTIHWGAAWAVAQTNLVVCFLVAFCFGQFVLHSAGALLHETAHRLVFRRPWAKLAFDLGLEVILASFAKQLTYQYEHVSSHHPYLGNYERDYEHEDVCRYQARRAHGAKHPRRQRYVLLVELLVHLLPLGFVLADEIFPRFYRWASGQGAKDVKRDIGATKPLAAERWLFIAVSLAANAALFFAFGWLAWLYHIWCLSIFIGKCGVTNLGQSLSEHDGDDAVNPTKSVYWWGNRILFNTGYHNEHHTFPNVAWSRLPALRALAPESFHSISEKSYVRLWWEHVRNDFSPSRRNPYIERDNSDRCR